jgi:hypothetical protein
MLLTKVQRDSNAKIVYYLYANRCLLIKGSFMPEMSCAFVVKIDNGTEV